MKYFTQTRDYGVVTDDPIRVAQIIEGFEADWEHRDWLPDPDTGLLWSNANSRGCACRTLSTTPNTSSMSSILKFVDAVILDRLLAAADRGVHVRVLCGGKHGISDWDVLDTFSSLRVLKRFGVKVHKQKNLRLHAKLLIADESHALVGSMNIDRSAFDLAPRTRHDGQRGSSCQASHGSLSMRIGSFRTATMPPDPLDPEKHKETDFPHDHELRHE